MEELLAQAIGIVIGSGFIYLALMLDKHEQDLGVRIAFIIVGVAFLYTAMTI